MYIHAAGSTPFRAASFSAPLDDGMLSPAPADAHAEDASNVAKQFTDLPDDSDDDNVEMGRRG